MIACLDVHYKEDGAVPAAVLAPDWRSDRVLYEATVAIAEVEPYVPGQFFKRELPCLRAALDQLPAAPSMIVIDGYVWLGPNQEPGLGAHLFEALNRSVPVVGVAKNRFRDGDGAVEVLRGGSRRPLYVSAAGIDQQEAARHVESMHGLHRLPTLLKRVDQLCRGLLPMM